MPLQEEPTLVSTFYVGGTLMGVDAMKVQEVVQLSSLTPVHHASDYIAGIINLRGQIVTVVDLKCRLEIDQLDDQPARDIFIVSSHGENIGLLVDEAADVIPADMDNLAPLPANMSAVQQKFLKGICQSEIRPIAILDINSVLSVD
ncbi:MAG TPA: chemotaxis protein CheW [Anaerolineales bacterium]|jgi:purine-binding chemotaxis protein CheW|nr:chemotaxis protein CheW [Anaerolineales bacterium]